MLLAQAPLPARSFLHGQPTNRAVPFRRASLQHLSRSARRRQTPARRAPRAGLLDIFTGGGGGSKSSPKKDELVEELYDAVKGTDAGLKASPEERERIEDLVSAAPASLCALYAWTVASHRVILHWSGSLTESDDLQVEQLSRFSIRAPTRSEYFYGEFEVRSRSRSSASQEAETQVVAAVRTAPQLNRLGLLLGCPAGVSNAAADASLDLRLDPDPASRSRTAPSLRRPAARSGACRGAPCSRSSGCGRACRRGSW